MDSLDGIAAFALVVDSAPAAAARLAGAQGRVCHPALVAAVLATEAVQARADAGMSFVDVVPELVLAEPGLGEMLGPFQPLRRRVGGVGSAARSAPCRQCR